MPGRICRTRLASKETRLIASMILPLAISTSIMLLCLPMISKISFLDMVKPSSFKVSSEISIIRSESFCCMSVILPP